MPAITRRSVLTPYMNVATGALIISLMFAYVYLLINMKDDKAGMSQLGLLMLVQLTPFLFLVTRGRFNFLGFILFNHFISYSLAKYNQLKTITKGIAFEHGAIAAIREMTLCSILIVVAYYSTRYLFGGSRQSKQKYDFLHMTRNQYLYGGLFVISQPLILEHVPGSLATMYFVLNSVILVILLCAKPESEILERWVRGGIVLSTIAYFLKYGSLAVLGTLGGVIFIVSFVQWKPRNFFLVAVIVLLASAIQTVKMEYRMAFQENPAAGGFQRVSTLVDLLAAQFIDGHITRTEIEDVEGTDVEADDEAEDEGLSSGLLKGFSRVGDDSLERVLEMTPSIVPFWGGETYEYLPFMFIPRVLWPEKPEKVAWNKFGRLYKFLSSDDTDTSVGFNFLAEGYMNFGYTGLYTIAILFGALVSLVEKFSFYALNGYFYFSFIIFLIPLMTYGYDFVSMLNSLLLTGSVVFILRTVLLPMARRDEYGLAAV